MHNNRASVLARITALYVDKLASPILEPFGLSLAQYKILGYLYRKPKDKVTTGELETYFQMSHSTSVGLLNHLEASGFIKREKRPGSGRSKAILLTPKAKTIEDDLEAAGLQLEKAFTARLSADEAAEYIRLSRKILDIPEGEED